MNVRFDEPADMGLKKSTRGKASGIAEFIIRIGLAKNEAGANLVMLIIIIVAFGSIFFLLPGTIADIPAPTPEQVILQ